MTKRQAMLPFLTLMAVTLFSHSTRAAEYTGPRTIVGMGCDNADTYCNITLSGTAVGNTVGCPSTILEWDSVNDPNGKNTYAALMAAFISGLQVNVYISACFAPSPTYPTISFFNVYN